MASRDSPSHGSPWASTCGNAGLLLSVGPSQPGLVSLAAEVTLLSQTPVDLPSAQTGLIQAEHHLLLPLGSWEFLCLTEKKGNYEQFYNSHRELGREMNKQ